MTSDQLRASVDRLQELLPDLRQCADDAESLPVTLGKDDVDALETVLASLPDLERLRRESDPTEITEEWIASLNPPRYWEAGREHSWPCVSLRYSCELVGVGGRGEPGFYIDGRYEPHFLNHVKTRGDVRRLFAALGITLKEPQP